MKPYTKQEVAKATRMAYNFIYSIQSVLMNKTIIFDRRLRVGKLANAYLIIWQLSADDKIKVLAKMQRRRKEKFTHTNILDNKILNDWRKNRPAKIYDTHLSFYGRNHWAKTPQDFKVIKVLKKFN